MAKANAAARMKFKPDAPIGSAAAEDDEAFLETCFVDTGNIETLLDPNSGKRIVVGRTGAGKSALLRMLADRSKRVIQIDPQDLAIQHISNSSVIRHFSKLGVNMDAFYQSLWQHIFCIELLKEKFNVENNSSFSKLFDRWSATWAWDRRKKRAWEYLQSWGNDEFWSDTRSRAVRMTSKIEDSLNGAMKLSIGALKGGLEASRRGVTEMTEEVVHDAQQIVDAVKLKELHEVMDLLNDHIFNDERERYYIIIDDLDRNWVDSQVRYRLIRALVESIKRFKKLKNVKVIISLRRDLLDKVIEQTRDIGFQEEKYEDLYFQIRWTEDALKQIVAKRIALMAERAYSKKSMTFENLFPPKVGSIDTFRYVISRTHGRPREVIQFVNKVLEVSAGKSEISKKSILEAEDNYSEQRLRALYDEWLEYLPALRQCTSVLAGPKKSFRLEDLDFEKVQNCILEAATHTHVETDNLARAAKRIIDEQDFAALTDTKEFLRELFSTFHKLGLVGIKLNSQSSVRWCDDAVGYVRAAAIELDTFAEIHPMYQRAFGVRTLGESTEIDEPVKMRRAV